MRKYWYGWKYVIKFSSNLNLIKKNKFQNLNVLYVFHLFLLQSLFLKLQIFIIVYIYIYSIMSLDFKLL